MSDKIRLGIFGSSSGDMTVSKTVARQLGRVLRDYSDSLILVTGACPGLPYAVIAEASSSGIEIWGYSSSLDAMAQKNEYPDDDLSMYSKMIYVSPDFALKDNPNACKKYRNLIATASCDAGIIVSGLWGTLNEFTDLVDLQKTIGVVTGTGGVADELPHLTQKIIKPDQGEVIFDSDPAQLVQKVLGALN